MDLKSMNSLHLPRQTEHSKLDIVYTFIVILYYIVPIFSARCRKTRAHSLSFFSLSLLHSCKNDLHIPIFTIALIRNRISVQKIVLKSYASYAILKLKQKKFDYSLASYYNSTFSRKDRDIQKGKFRTKDEVCSTTYKKKNYGTSDEKHITIKKFLMVEIVKNSSLKNDVYLTLSCYNAWGLLAPFISHLL